MMILRMAPPHRPWNPDSWPYDQIHFSCFNCVYVILCNMYYECPSLDRSVLVFMVLRSSNLVDDRTRHKFVPESIRRMWRYVWTNRVDYPGYKIPAMPSPQGLDILLPYPTWDFPMQPNHMVLVWEMEWHRIVHPSLDLTCNLYDAACILYNTDGRDTSIGLAFVLRY